MCIVTYTYVAASCQCLSGLPKIFVCVTMATYIIVFHLGDKGISMISLLLSSIRVVGKGVKVCMYTKQSYIILRYQLEIKYQKE